LVSLLVAACGADNTDGITFTVQGVPALFDAKLDDATWQTFKPKSVYQGNAIYNIPTFLSTIDAVFVCESANGTFDAREIRTTDANELYADCYPVIDIGDREQLVVTIHNATPHASVNVYDVDMATSGADGALAIQAPVPRADVIVADQGHLMVMHDVDTGHGPTGVTIDMASAPPGVVGHYAYDAVDTGETFADDDLFWTANGSRMFVSFGPGGYVAPDPSLRASNDEIDITVLALSLTENRSVSVYNVDPATTFSTHWLPHITGAFDPVRTAATFDPYEIDNDSLGISCSAMGGHQQEGVTIERSYRDRRSDDLSFTEDIPGWGWTLTGSGRRCQATVFQWAPTRAYSDTAFVMQPATPASAAPSDWRSYAPWRAARARTRR
jgi:hypothetical protein